MSSRLKSISLELNYGKCNKIELVPHKSTGGIVSQDNVQLPLKGEINAHQPEDEDTVESMFEIP